MVPVITFTIFIAHKMPPILSCGSWVIVAITSDGGEIGIIRMAELKKILPQELVVLDKTIVFRAG